MCAYGADDGDLAVLREQRAERGAELVERRGLRAHVDEHRVDGLVDAARRDARARQEEREPHEEREARADRADEQQVVVRDAVRERRQREHAVQLHDLPQLPVGEHELLERHLVRVEAARLLLVLEQQALQTRAHRRQVRHALHRRDTSTSTSTGTFVVRDTPRLILEDTRTFILEYTLLPLRVHIVLQCTSVKSLTITPTSRQYSTGTF